MLSIATLASGDLQAHGFLAAIESRVDASLPPAVTTASRDSNVVSLYERLAESRRVGRF